MWTRTFFHTAGSSATHTPNSCARSSLSLGHPRSHSKRLRPAPSSRRVPPPAPYTIHPHHCRCPRLRSRTPTKVNASRDYIIPDTLRQQDGKSATTAFNLRFITDSRRGSGLSEPYAGVRLALISEDRVSSLHTIPRYDDTNEYGRFESGSVDEIVVDSSLEGEVIALWVAPELGTWRLRDVELTKENGKTVRFSCSTLLGDDDNAAIELRPEAKVILSPEERARLFEDGLQDYVHLKQSILTTNIVLVMAGMAAAFGIGGGVSANAVACGGGIGMMYSYLLQRQVDGLGSAPTSFKGFMDAAASGPGRLLLVFILACACIQGLNLQDPAGTNGISSISLLFFGGLGFFMYKIAFIYVGFRESSSPFSSDEVES